MLGRGSILNARKQEILGQLDRLSAADSFVEVMISKVDLEKNVDRCSVSSCACSFF